MLGVLFCMRASFCSQTLAEHDEGAFPASPEDRGQSRAKRGMS